MLTPVSYTHLDVYKRQRDAHALLHAAGELLGQRLFKALQPDQVDIFLRVCLTGGLIPVSYTHLDVYKRQPTTWRRPFIWATGSSCSAAIRPA